MEGLLKTLAVFMLILLLSTQFLLNSPFRSSLTDDSINGRELKTNESLIYKGQVTLDALGQYTSNEVAVLVNGQLYKTIDKFPIELNVIDGDFVEIRLQRGNKPFYVFLAAQIGQVKTDLLESTILVSPGINRAFKVLAKR